MPIPIKYQFCATIEMNNILFLNICLLAVTAMVYSYPESDEGDASNVAAYTGGRASISESRLNSWSRSITRQRRDADHKNHNPMYGVY